MRLIARATDEANTLMIDMERRNDDVNCGCDDRFSPLLRYFVAHGITAFGPDAVTIHVAPDSPKLFGSIAIYLRDTYAFDVDVTDDESKPEPTTPSPEGATANEPAIETPEPTTTQSEVIAAVVDALGLGR